MRQRTLKLPIEISGIGLHSGKLINIKILPAKEDSGIIFRYRGEDIKASICNLIQSPLCSAITKNKTTIFTIEHLLSALFALNIDNAFIETDGEEIPILDGSAVVFAEKILEGGFRFQDVARREIIIRREVILKDQNRYAIARPSSEFKIKYLIEFKSRVIGRQSLALTITPENFIKEIAPARTFCEYSEIERMRDTGLIKGGSLDNAIVVDDYRIINRSPLRFINEFVRHKILDSIGDISLMGNAVIGEFEFARSGHNINHRLLAKILENPLNYEIVQTMDSSLQEEEHIVRHFAYLRSLLLQKTV